MNISRDDVKAEVYHTSNGISYAKVHLCGMAIVGIQVKKSVKYPERGLWVQMPAFKSGNDWRKYVEFDKDAEIREWIEDACRQAAALKQPTELDDFNVTEELDRVLGGYSI